MSFESAFLDCMNSTVRISTRSSHNNYGEPTFAGTTTSYRARIVEKRDFVRTASGEVLETSHVLWIRSTAATTITTDDRITLPNGATPQILMAERYPDGDGIHHTKLILGH